MSWVRSVLGPKCLDTVNKQGQPIVRKSSDAAMKRYADEYLLQMIAIFDVQQIQLPIRSYLLTWIAYPVLLPAAVKQCSLMSPS